MLLALLLLEHLGDAFSCSGERFNAVGDLLQELDLRIGLAWGHRATSSLQRNCQYAASSDSARSRCQSTR